MKRPTVFVTYMTPTNLMQHVETENKAKNILDHAGNSTPKHSFNDCEWNFEEQTHNLNHEIEQLTHTNIN